MDGTARYCWKARSSEGRSLTAKVFHAHLFGTRESKYERLAESDVSTTQWTEDTQHYQKVVVALNETIRLMTEIDEVIGQHGGWPMR